MTNTSPTVNEKHRLKRIHNKLDYAKRKTSSESDKVQQLQVECNELEGKNLDIHHQNKKLKAKLVITEVSAEKVAHALKDRSKRVAIALANVKKTNDEQKKTSKAMLRDQEKIHATEMCSRGRIEPMQVCQMQA